MHYFCCCYCLVVKLYLILATPWTVARQVPLSMGFPRQEYWRGLPFTSPGDLPNPRMSPVSPALAGGFFTAEPPGKWYFLTRLFEQIKGIFIEQMNEQLALA